MPGEQAAPELLRFGHECLSLRHSSVNTARGGPAETSLLHCAAERAQRKPTVGCLVSGSVKLRK
jgi:hypothetical protein